MLDTVYRDDVLVWASATPAAAALPRPLDVAKSVSMSAPPHLSSVFADVVARKNALVAAFADAHRAGIDVVEADLALRRAPL